jgi:hypothetical protein
MTANFDVQEQLAKLAIRSASTGQPKLKTQPSPETLQPSPKTQPLSHETRLPRPKSQLPRPKAQPLSLETQPPNIETSEATATSKSGSAGPASAPRKAHLPSSPQLIHQ